MKYIKILFSVVIMSIFVFTACVKDLDTIPIDKDDFSSATVYKDSESYVHVLAKIYGGFVLTGQQGPAGNADLRGVDEGFSEYFRNYWYIQEFSTDEAISGWENDEGLFDINFQTWDATNPFVQGIYTRIFYEIVLINEFLRETTDAKLEERGHGDLKEVIKTYRAEARFIRAMSYWHALDLFANVPFVTEDDGIGSFFPVQTNSTDLFNFVESELIEILPNLVDARQNEYTRADKAAAWMVLAKLYLNAEVYISHPKYSECLTYCNKIIEAGYSIEERYQDLFCINNEGSDEAIFLIAFDGERTQSWGGMTFLINGSIGGSMNPSEYGVEGSWAGSRATKALFDKFDVNDGRGLFYTTGQTLEIDNVVEFTQGVAVTKYRNLKYVYDNDGNVIETIPGSNSTHPDADFPMFRLGDVYLMYAEIVARGAGGDASTAAGYVNQLRERAFGNSDENITAADLTEEFILDERARELFWEAQRRTDLIRFGKYSGGGYLWPWKGNVKDGTATDAKYNLLPIPATDIASNPNLIQNSGY
ncbi:MAG: RagB/SusD family nutrient uptake outer membrane protein [Bacteroidetes bacterium]|jgi:starch-binding outer membrane protein, SusD/RagB family|nr:RagB/SusD family nutrient uptake outer membrane protein [Bacteroidota bacterium]MBT6686920.1 RagB/SusD family nutrient uptake outer membrane protein [Bacteroidota bacterium]MBT7143226.1 RagB/SusD family nutrient uptake outer membrane protein [Bacteroidota bacterium]MBT7492796.1 RagB/SusD family nutrient uptake outer membrane protein [Bacteroidota bacterium]